MKLPQIGFVAGEMKEPTRDLPRVINTAMTIVIIGFVLMNAALYVAIPIQKMRETNTPVTVSYLLQFSLLLCAFARLRK